MKPALIAAVLVLAAVLPAAAAEQKKPASSTFTTLNSCALKGRGFEIGDGVCLKVTGGVYVQQSFGNAVGGTEWGEPGGLPIVNTPAGTYTIPVPR
ncbi:MAG: hypothetical protein ACTHOR_17365 [Devosia sp.]|jgi:hypothetical protein